MSQNGAEPNALPTLLLVDDERPFADALAFRLQTRGIGCLAAYSGEEALRLLERREFEVVLLDLNMPGLHGLEALRLIKEKRPDVEVVLLTGDADFSVAATGMRRGAGDYLIKPVDLEDVLVSVAKAEKRTRERKERMRAAEAGKLIALGTLAAGVGHELNNPLQILLHRAEWLQELVEDAQNGAPDYAEMQKTAQVLQEQARRAGSITARLLDLACRSQGGRTDVMELVDSAVKEYAGRAAALGVTIGVTAEASLPPVACSPAELLAVLSHLVDNALDAVAARAEAEKAFGAKHSVNSGHPPRNGARTGDPDVRILARQSGGMLLLGVDDNGCGLSPEVAGRMYEPFFSTRQGRTGLGLSLCHTIVTGLGGRLEHGAAAAPLTGARFTAAFPLTG